jgi:ESS family glutamate:Na+ symporter
MDTPYLVSLLVVLALLLVGFALRAWLKPLRVLFVPASVVGGLVGLVVVQAGLRVGPGELQGYIGPTSYGLVQVDDDGGERFFAADRATGKQIQLDQELAAPSASQRATAEVSGVIDGWPGLLIAVVFAGLLMERSKKTFRESARRAGRQGIFVYVVGVGEAFVGLLACALLIAPFYDVPRAFGQLIETGFIGGHGTAAAMGDVFRNVFDFPQGRDLAFLFATVGLVYGVVSGIFFVNLGVRRGWVRRKADATPGGLAVPIVSGLEDRADPKPSAFARVRSDVIDPLAFQLCLLGVAFGVGFLLQQGFELAVDRLLPPYEGDDKLRDPRKYLGNVPLFLFTLLGGWLVREAMHLLKLGDLIDPPSLHRLTGIAMELLIVAALATLRIEAARDFLWPILLLLTVGFAWTAFCLLVLARRMLPKEYWFELGLMNYGMSTATTAQGILLLRIVDRDLESGAAEDYAAAAPLSAPFIGGGVVTLLATPFALAAFGYTPVLLVMAVVLVGLFLLSRWAGRSDRAT